MLSDIFSKSGKKRAYFQAHHQNPHLEINGIFLQNVSRKNQVLKREKIYRKNQVLKKELKNWVNNKCNNHIKKVIIAAALATN